MALKKINREDLKPLLEGVAILDTGGGGSPDWGRGIILNDFKRAENIPLLILMK